MRGKRARTVPRKLPIGVIGYGVSAYMVDSSAGRDLSTFASFVVIHFVLEAKGCSRE